MVGQSAVIRIRRMTSVQWADLNPVLDSGEQGLEIDTRRYKIGDGFTKWNDLDYYLVKEEMMLVIHDEIVHAAFQASGVSNETFEEHVNSENPHPAFDDGTSFLLLYENAKV